MATGETPTSVDDVTHVCGSMRPYICRADLALACALLGLFVGRLCSVDGRIPVMFFLCSTSCGNGPVASVVEGCPSLRLLRGIGDNSSRTKWSKNRSVMPLDVLGRTRATMCRAESIPIREDRVIMKIGSRLGLGLENVPHELGIPSMRKSLPCVD